MSHRCRRRVVVAVAVSVALCVGAGVAGVVLIERAVLGP